ncbi:hypothetical protein P3T76_001546 [Phytophthora citrophthora]|uniref:Uncharacterized protein n=1 Tax=Phytophthora citrophthora TaxID=4793 RepID=A0AAD9H0X0_9STRA|nr:hypothetical protein P3T76_001546 [Phytophthora citrophthora]
MTQKVWFQLVDEETRGAYEDAQKASVSSDVANDIGDLRQEIWNRFRDDTLEDIVADQLCIYYNRAVYDDEDGQSLEDDSPIGSFGTASDAHIVVVKLPVLKPPTPLILTVQASYPAF